MVEIIKHHEFEETYDDADHPIPSLTHLDVCLMLKGGGANLAIIIAKPIQSDEYSQTRLLEKIERYLGHIKSEGFIAEAGTPNPSNTTIEIHIHPDSSPEIFDLIERCRAWIEENDASLKVTLHKEYK